MHGRKFIFLQEKKNYCKERPWIDNGKRFFFLFSVGEI